MSTPPFFHWRALVPGLLSIAMIVSLWAVNVSGATTPAPVQISSDQTTGGGAQHNTEIEPVVAGFGSTLVAVFQEGRQATGGSLGIGYATSTDGGATWSHTGLLPGIIGTSTTFSGSVTAATNPQVAFDATHNVWLVMSVGLSSANAGIALLVNTSSDGFTWNSAVDIEQGVGVSWDKPSLVCDNASTFKGTCYAEWDDASAGGLLYASNTSDGGTTWSNKTNPTGSPTGFSGNAVVSPSGTVLVPFTAPDQKSIATISSANGGATWTTGISITTGIAFEAPPFGMGNQPSGNSQANGMRLYVLPSAAADKNGTFYVSWQETNLESDGCCINDIVMASSTSPVTSWGAVKAITPANSGNDSFLPALAADPNAAGDLALEYFFIPNAAALNGQSASSCTAAGPPQCQIFVGFMSSTNGGTSWSTNQQLAGPMTIPDLAQSTIAPQGAMLGDFIQMTFLNDSAYPVFPFATTPSNSTLNEAIYTIPGGILVGSATPTPTTTATVTITSTATTTPTASPTGTSTPKVSPTGTSTPAGSPTATSTPHGSPTVTGGSSIYIPLVYDQSSG
jgi:hypothetical protein